MSLDQSTNRQLLPDGRVMKDTARVESIVTRYEERVEYSPSTWQGSRLLRRDFNAMSVKMVLLQRRAEKRSMIKHLLDELTYEANYLSDRTAGCPAMGPGAEDSTLPLRVISPEARVLLDALRVFDLALAKLQVKAGPEEAQLQSADFLRRFGQLKGCLFGRN